MKLRTVNIKLDPDLEELFAGLSIYLHANGQVMYTTGPLARLIMNPPKGFVVEFKSDDNLDFRRSNLCIALKGSKASRTSTLRNNTERERRGHVKGVVLDKSKRYWSVWYRYQGENIYIGQKKEWFEAVCLRKATEARFSQMESALGIETEK